MATPFPTTGTQEGDIAAGLIQNGVYNPNIDVSKITPVSPIKLPELPPTDNYQAILAGLQGSLPEEATYKKTQEDVLAKTKELGGADAFLAEKEKELGVDVDRKSLINLQSELRAVNNEAQAAILDLDRPDRATRLTAGSVLDKGVIERDRTIKALRLSSSIQALQGNLALANDQAQRAVDLKYNALKTELEVLNRQLDFNRESFNSAEKKRADALKKVNDEKLEKLELERKVSESWVKTKNDALADGVPLSIVNTAQQFFDAKQEDKARSLLGSYVKPKAPSSVSTSPLSILDIGRYNEAYPDAGVTAGDSEAQANAKVRALSQPKEFTDEEFRQIARESKDAEKKSYEDTIKEIEANPFIANKDRALLIAKEVYGKQEKPLSVRASSMERQIEELKKGGILQNSDIRYALKQRGFTSQEVNKSSIGLAGASLIDSISNFLFK